MPSSPRPEEPQGEIPLAIHAAQDSKNFKPKGRTIIVCLDGTGDQFDHDNSNVVNFVRCLKKDDPNQVTYYQAGIGTYSGDHGLKDGITASLDMAVGSGLGFHIKDAYRFLMQNYNEGDKVCLLGFSRGAYTVRCLAGMIHKVGLLPAHNGAQVSFAYNFYKNDNSPDWKMSREFKETFCINIEVYFVGLWDCVASVGFIPRKLPFSKSATSSVHYFRHAMALDEHRAKFKICQWQRRDLVQKQETVDRTPKAKVKSEKNKQTEKVKEKKHRHDEKKEAEGKLKQIGKIRGVFRSCFGPKNPGSPGNEDRDGRSSTSSARSKQEEREKEFEKKDTAVHDHVSTDVSEVWFMGSHADADFIISTVGGGAVLNEERHMLSRIPLRWMIRQCFECNTGIIFCTAALAEAGIDVPDVWPIYKKPSKPVVGPSPNMIEQYEAGELPSLRRRSTALGVDPEQRKKSMTGSSSKDDDVYFDATSEHNEKHPSEKFWLLPEHAEDHFDAMAPINDQLVQAKSWWVLEFWPVKVRVQKSDEQWQKVVRMNLGRFRAILDTEPNMHWTVQMRMSDKNYKIRNRLDKNATWQVTA
ncbi:hypothetical protein HYALB_00011283 [Hymenoscyphus albidus]|uniref:T6SS Phospholipase effector Tle1-like catalytic domain-containing protein n=1 Tax=Hymenoscyphus albidus TaxID=595503 RepID=A0A9N9LVA2_9HELO|nr:hypothetical protein HYALB_00011283 [Hymenoscyphus albidus]